MRILVVNAGSSSLKLRLLDDADVVLKSADLPADAGGFDTAVLAGTLQTWPGPDVVGHRVVHGGTEYDAATLVDDVVLLRLRALTDLAPLHQPLALAGLDAVGALLPDVPAVACFDTGFHTTIPAEAATYAIPAEWRARHAIRRFGFHGLSHAYACRRAAELVERPLEQLRIVTCHLGSGASLCATVGGASVDTTMGFTPLEGLVMATRSGTIDPGLVPWLEEHENLSSRQILEALETRSGLLALAGTGDMREIQRRAEADDTAARFALGVYLHRLVCLIAAMAAAADGFDVLAFTGGVGEHSPMIRGQVAERLAWTGLRIDEARNLSAQGDLDVTATRSLRSTVVVTAREDLQIARETRMLMSAPPTKGNET